MTWLRKSYKGSIYEVVSLPAMIGKRGLLSREDYQRYHQEADEIAAMLSGLARAAAQKRKTP